MQRFDSIDVLRAVALILMVPCHFVLFFSPYQAPHEWIFTLFNDALGGLSAPLFLFLVGVSLAVSLAKRGDDGGFLGPTGLHLLRKAALVFVFGVILELSIEGAVFTWDVLSFIACSLVALCFARRLSNPTLLILTVALFVLAPWLRAKVGYLHHWSPSLAVGEFAQHSPSLFLDPLEEYRFGTDTNLWNVIKGMFVTGYFPLFPWLAFPLMGLVLGRALFVHHGRWAKPLFGGAALLMVAGGLTTAWVAHQTGILNFESGYLTTLSFFPLSPSWMLVQMGFCMGALLAMHRLLDHRERHPEAFTFYRFLSKYSLTAYWFHYLIVYWPPRIANALSDGETEHFGNMMDAPTAVLFSIVTVIGFYFLFMLWERRGGKFSPGWFIDNLAASFESNHEKGVSGSETAISAIHLNGASKAGQEMGLAR